MSASKAPISDADAQRMLATLRDLVNELQSKPMPLDPPRVFEVLAEETDPHDTSFLQVTVSARGLDIREGERVWRATWLELRGVIESQRAIERDEREIAEDRKVIAEVLAEMKCAAKKRWPPPIRCGWRACDAVAIAVPDLGITVDDLHTLRTDGGPPRPDRTPLFPSWRKR